MLLLKKRVLKPALVIIAMLSLNYSYAQPKTISPELIKEFIEFIERNAMSVTTYLDNSKDLSIFTKMLKLTKTYDTLKSDDDVTIFAPVNAAYDQFPVEVMNELFNPKNIEKLRSIVTYHIINGKLSASDIIDEIDKNGGKQARFKAINGLDIVAYYDENDLYIKDDNGYSIKIMQHDIHQSNGIVYKIETVILPQVDNREGRE